MAQTLPLGTLERLHPRQEDFKITIHEISADNDVWVVAHKDV